MRAAEDLRHELELASADRGIVLPSEDGWVLCNRGAPLEGRHPSGEKNYWFNPTQCEDMLTWL